MSGQGQELPHWFDTGLVDAAQSEREALRRRRARAALGVSVAVTLLWAIFVTVTGHWGRVADNWASSLTMVFGSFVAGSTPQGGGAVGFPVFTKALGVPADVARTFSLCIQTIGMGTASLAILISRRVVELRVVAVGGSVATVSFVGGLYLLGDPTRPFWPSTIPGAYVKVTFSLVLAAMAVVVYLGTRVLIRKVDRTLPPLNARLWVGLVVAGILGGLTSALVGSGADVFVYLFVVVLFGLDPKVGVPTSVVVMAIVSVLGFVLLGLVDGQLSTMLSPDGSTVVAVGGQAVAMTTDMTVVYGHAPGALARQQFDLYGLWLAAAPVVAWGAPMGSWAASRMTARGLVRFVVVLATAELLSTAIFLDELHRPGPLLLFAVVGLVVTSTGLYVLARYRRRVFRLPGLDLDQSLSAEYLDVAPGYDRQVRRQPRNGSRGPGK